MELTFLIHFLNIVGAPPTWLELLIVFWVLGKWLQEVEEMWKRGFKGYLGDYWNYFDIFYLSLFASTIALRSDMDYIIVIALRTINTSWP